MKHKVLIEEVIMAYRKLVPKKKKGICETIFDPNFKYEKSELLESYGIHYEKMCPAR